MALEIEQYGVYRVDLNPVRGSELDKKRPAVIVSDDDMNRALQTVVVCPMTTRIHPQWPSRVRVEVSDMQGEVAVDQIRTISIERIGQRFGTIDAIAARSIRHVITEMYGLLSIPAAP